MADLLSLSHGLQIKFSEVVAAKQSYACDLSAQLQQSLSKKIIGQKPAFPITVLKSITWGRSPML